MSKGTVLLTGASGFIAQHIVLRLLNENYKVIGTVRSESTREKIDNLFKNENLVLEIVPDISNLNAFDEVLAKYSNKIDYVLHTASPFTFNVNDYEKDLLIPALNGTKSILNAIKEHSVESVKRVIITSSYAAITTVGKDGDANVTFNEHTWNPATWESCQSDPVSAYCGSKTFAEKVAWDFVKKNAGSINFTLTTVNPVIVFGPQLFDASVGKNLNTSCELINDIVNYKEGVTQFDPDYFFSFVDVRDVSKAHVLALEKKEAIGKRLFLIAERFSNIELCNIIAKKFPQLKNKMPRNVDFENNDGKALYSKAAYLDNSETKKILGFEFISLEKSIDDTVEQLLRVNK
ncbi:related to NADPH-dependent methylglyoxal reductase GRE2 [Saccharomycodes ludwigii]|uniref:Related to NADPH-dependent methylglyoxal reductase GRE2 n=1 Tax=Saccharomycodes ludwigii TaxID=36035 RepID=A0A376B675_9ASCO|nr:related to NADPH-dependent methylglyoxal reductase GRE2 [Saccharomycodes ludwigii]